MKKKYVFHIDAQAHYSVLSRVTQLFSRRQIQFESFCVSEIDAKNLQRIVLVIQSDQVQVPKLVGQLEKLVDIVTVRCSEERSLLQQEIALYRLPASVFDEQLSVEELVKDYGTRILKIAEGSVVLEKTGKKNEVQALYERLKPKGLLEFSRSGLVGV